MSDLPPGGGPQRGGEGHGRGGVEGKRRGGVEEGSRGAGRGMQETKYLYNQYCHTLM